MNTSGDEPTRPEGLQLEQLVAHLRHSREFEHKIRHRDRVRELPSRVEVEVLLDELKAALFPTHFGRRDLTDDTIDYFVGSTLQSAYERLSEQVRRSLHFTAEGEAGPDGSLSDRARSLARVLLARLPEIRALVVSDLRAALAGDPAAANTSEILLCYPGILATISHRIAHVLFDLGAVFLARMMASIAQAETGVDIHPGARIGRSFFIDHGTGVVIGETSIIGDRVRIYQAVTLGSKRFPTDETGTVVRGMPRHPIVEDDVVIYAGATVLGRITVGKGSVVGGGVWLTRSIAPGTVVTQAELSSKQSPPAPASQGPEGGSAERASSAAL